MFAYENLSSFWPAGNKHVSGKWDTKTATLFRQYSPLLRWKTAWLRSSKSSVVFSKNCKRLTRSSETSILELATWTPKLSAVDATRVIAGKPKFFGPAINADEATYTGNNDNETPRGFRIVGDTTIPSLTARYAGLSPVAFDKYKQIFAKANKTLDFPTVGTYLLAGEDQIVCMKGGGPLPIYAPFISTPSGGQLGALTYFNVSFDLAKEWYLDVVVLKLNFKHDILSN